LFKNLGFQPNTAGVISSLYISITASHYAVLRAYLAVYFHPWIIVGAITGDLLIRVVLSIFTDS